MPTNPRDVPARIIEQIEAAFAGVSLGDGVSMREADVIDSYGTQAERVAARQGDELHDWRRIPDALLAQYDWSLSFFDAKGLHFHLPAYMCFALRHHLESDSASISGVIYTLARPQTYWDQLTESQRQAVREFLQFMAIQTGESRSVDHHAATKGLESLRRL